MGGKILRVCLRCPGVRSEASSSPCLGGVGWVGGWGRRGEDPLGPTHAPPARALPARWLPAVLCTVDPERRLLQGHLRALRRLRRLHRHTTGWRLHLRTAEGVGQGASSGGVRCCLAAPHKQRLALVHACSVCPGQPPAPAQPCMVVLTAGSRLLPLQCSEAWMSAGGYCSVTCGRCQAGAFVDAGLLAAVRPA